VVAASFSADEEDEARQLVLDFYRLIEERQYSQIADRVIEFNWEREVGEDARLTGLKTAQDFVDACDSELGRAATQFVVYNIEVQTDVPPARDPPELLALYDQNGAPALSGIIWMRVSGTVRIACTVWDFGRRLAVVRTEEGWRLLLPPPSRYTLSRLHAWLPQTIRESSEETLQ
jgi:hypothetical protein